MRIFNSDEFAFDLNAATNSYWIEENAPVVYKWLTRKLPRYLQTAFPEYFKPVQLKKNLVGGLKPRLFVQGENVKLQASTDFDLKDAQAGLLLYYTGKDYLVKTQSSIFRRLRLSPLIEWLLWVHQHEPKLDLMKVTYEVAVKKMTELEQRKLAHFLAEEAKRQKEKAAFLERIQKGELHPIRIPFTAGYIFQLFHLEEEFRQEGAAQGNCVHWLMWPKFHRGSTLIGGIRSEAEPDLPWITIELNTQNFSLIQAEFDSNRDAAETPVVRQLEAFIQENRALMTTLRQEVFAIDKAIHAVQLEKQLSGDLRFAVRL